MIHDKTIRVGAYNWEHAHWLGSFYPQDLPADWRLGYYANEFSAVLVAETKWRAEDVDFEQWAEDVPDGFRFYFLTSTADVDEKKFKKILGVKFAGFVWREQSPTIALIDFQSKTLREWKNWLLETDCGAIFLMDENLSSKQLSDFQSLVELMGL